MIASIAAPLSFALQLSVIQALALTAAATQTAEPQAAEGGRDFLLALEKVRELVADEAWASAQKAIEALLRDHERRPYVFARRAELADDLEQCAFWSAHERPEPRELVSGELVRYEPSGGTIVLRYRPGDLTDFICADAREHKSGLRGTLAPEDVLVHPAVFSGPHEIEIRGSCYPGIGAKRLPTILVGVAPNENIQIAYGLPRTRRGDTTYWQEPAIRYIGGDETKTLDSREEALTRPGQSFRLEVESKSSTIAARYDGKTIMSAKRPAGSYGRVGFTGLEDFQEIEISGKVDRAWIDGLADEKVSKARMEFRKRSAIEERLPEWLRLGEAHWELELPVGEYPGEQRPGRVALLREAWVLFKEPKGEAAASRIEELVREEPEEPGLLFRTYLSVLLDSARGDHQKALASCRELRAKSPEFLPARALGAELALRLGLREEARTELEVLESDPRFWRWALAWRAALSLLEGAPEAVEPILNAAAERGAYGAELDSVARMLHKSRTGPRWRSSNAFESDHFRVCSDLPKATCVEAAERLESAFRNFESALPGKAELRGRKFQVYLFSGQASYLLYTSDVLFSPAENTAGLYSPTLKQLLIWNIEERERMMAVVRHEGLHQYLDLLVGDAPRWLNEGLAEYFEAADFTRTGDKQYPPVDQYVRWLRSEPKAWIPLDRFLYETPEEFMRTAPAHYAQAWALVHFLRHGPRDYRELLDQLLERLIEGSEAPAALTATFGSLDLAKMENALRGYVAGLD